MTDPIPYDQAIPPVIIEPLRGRDGADSAFIFLHGFGDEGSSYQNLADQIQKAGLLQTTRFIFPTADFMRDAGERAWYMPIPVQDEDAEGDLKHYQPAIDLADHLIQQQVDSGIPRRRIVLGGFSQGSAVTALWGATKQCSGNGAQRQQERLAGLVMIAGYVPMRARFKQMIDKQEGVREMIRDQPLLVLHGQEDTLIPPWVMQKGLPVLEEAGFEVNWALFPGMRHNVPGVALGSLCNFLQSVLDVRTGTRETDS